MNFQTYATASGAEHDRHEDQRAQDVAGLQHPVDRQGEQQAEDVGEDDRPEREEEGVPHRAEQQRIVEDANEVVEADELPVSQTGPVREGEEPTGKRGDVVHADHQDDRGQRPPPVPVADQRLAATRSWRTPGFRGHGEGASTVLVDRHCHLLSDLVVKALGVNVSASIHYHTLASKSHISSSDIRYKSRRRSHPVVLVPAVTGCFGVTTDDDDDMSTALWNAFVDPPDEARPRAWWHWMDGNIDPAGIVRDLAWLHSVGVRGSSAVRRWHGSAPRRARAGAPGNVGMGRRDRHRGAHRRCARSGAGRRDLVGMERRRRPVGSGRRCDEEGRVVRGRRRRRRGGATSRSRPYRRWRGCFRTPLAGEHRMPPPSRPTGSCWRCPTTRRTTRCHPGERARPRLRSRTGPASSTAPSGAALRCRGTPMRGRRPGWSRSSTSR